MAPMGHAHHFLSRLDRVALPHVEIALSLYRDEALLRYIFDRARVPENAERVALSLDHPEDGPFLIVTRGGRFVTCLGVGMKVSDLPVVTRGQIDAIAAKASELRERLEAAKALAGGRGVKALLRRIYEAADELSREEFLAISALQPLYAHEFLKLYLNAACDLCDARDILLPQLRKTEKLKPAFDESLWAYWQTLWAMGHLVVLATLDGQETFPPGFVDQLEGTSFSWPTTRQGFLPFAIRGAWATARVGKPLLGRYKRYYQEALSFLQNIDGALGLLAIGMRHSRLRAEVEKALPADVSAQIKGTSHGDVARAIRDIAHSVAETDREAREGHTELQERLGARIWIAATKAKPERLARFAREEDVPRDLARTLAANALATYLTGSKGYTDAVVWLYMMTPWAARAAPEELYLPRSALQEIRRPWAPESTLEVLRAVREHEAPQHKEARPEGPTRKGPCPCGSGKKYKRCCEEKEAEAG